MGTLKHTGKGSDFSQVGPKGNFCPVCSKRNPLSAYGMKFYVELCCVDLAIEMIDFVKAGKIIKKQYPDNCGLT